MSRQQPAQQPPPVQRLQVRYAKRGRLRFTSHRDFSRAFERAVFRARVPMAYSSGFNPHPRISYAGAAPTGAASEAEYLEIALAQTVAAADVLARLQAAMPDGLDVVDVVDSDGAVSGGAAGRGAKTGFADRLEASWWSLETTADPEAARSAVRDFLEAESVLVQRMTKKGMRELDCRSAVVSLEVTTEAAARGSAGARLDLVLRHAAPAVRPDDVLTGLALVTGMEAGPAPRLTRLAQGPLDAATGEVRDPLR